MNSILTEVSRYLSYILRHNPSAAGVTMDEHGWVDVYDLVRGVRKKYPEFSYHILKLIVEMDEKQRYSFNEDRTKIRANQGHSVNVDVELEACEPPEVLFHGTGLKYIMSIGRDGLIPKSRLYVHLSKDSDTAIKVGKRHGDPVLYHVASGRMYHDGYEFFLSKNGVWLTKEVPVKYLRMIEV